MNFATILFLAASTTTLVLRSGDRIQVEGPVREANGVVVFRVPGGSLYSIPAAEVNVEATKAANPASGAQEQPLPKKLKVSPAERDRLLKELEQSRSGAPATLPDYESPLANDDEAGDKPDKAADEARWRAASRQYQERVQAAKDNVASLHERAEALRGSIRTYLSLGYSPDAFSYLTVQLSNTEAQIPQAEREVDRAQSAYDEFREDARKQGILPGWIR
jgi:hypothetical protein